MPKLMTDVVYCSPESISIGTGITEHLPARWEVYATVQDGKAMPLTKCTWFPCKPTHKQIMRCKRIVYAWWLVDCLYQSELVCQILSVSHSKPL